MIGKCPVCGSVDLFCCQSGIDGYDLYKCRKCGTEPIYYRSGSKPLSIRELMFEKLDDIRKGPHTVRKIK